jgi:hypothetical protein
VNDQSQNQKDVNMLPLLSTNDITEEKEEEEETSLVKDVTLSAISGVGEAIQGIVDTGVDLADKFGVSLPDKVELETSLGTFEVDPYSPFRRNRIPKYDSKTKTGTLVNNLSKYATSFYTTGQMFKAANIFQGTSKGVKLASSVAKSAIADATVLETYDQTVAGMLNEIPYLEKIIPDWFSIDEEDDAVEARVKHLLDGAITDIGMQAVFSALMAGRKAVVKAFEKGGKEAATQEIIKQSDEIGSLLTEQASTPVKPKSTMPLTETSSLIPDVSEAAQDIAKAIKGGSTYEPPHKTFVQLYNLVKAKTGNVGEAWEILIKEVEKTSDFKTQTNEETINKGLEILKTLFDNAGEDLGLKNSREFIQQVGNDPKVLRGLVTRRYAGVSLFSVIKDQLVTLASSPSLSPEQQKQLTTLFNDAVWLASRLKDVESYWGQLGQSFSITKPVMSSAGKNILDIVPPEAIKELSIAIGESNLSPSEIASVFGDVSKVAAKEGWWPAIEGAMTSGLLSNPATHVNNFFSSALESAVMPIEDFVGRTVTGDTQGAKAALRRYQGMIYVLKDSLNAAKLSWKYGRGFFAEGAAMGSNSAMAGTKVKYTAKVPIREAVGVNKDTFLGGLLDSIGEGLGLPLRAMGTTDEFLKNLNYRAYIYGEAYEEALQQGIKNKEEINSFIKNKIRKAYTNTLVDSPLINPKIQTPIYEALAPIKKDIIDYSLESSFAEAPVKGSLSEWLMRGSQIKAIKAVQPFIKAPLNIKGRVMQRTPGLNFLNAKWREMYNAGGAMRQRALGRLTVGTGMWALALHSVYDKSGKFYITGKGPDPVKEKDARDLWLAEGNQPYSIQWKDDEGNLKSLNIRRLEPFATILGIAADYRDNLDKFSDEDLSNIAASAVTSLTYNFTQDSTYMQGVSDLLDVLTDVTNDRFKKYAASFAWKFVPYNALINSSKKTIDPYYKETRAFLDTILAKLPLESKNIHSRFSWLSGEPISYPSGDTKMLEAGWQAMFNPYTIKKTKKDETQQLFAHLNSLPGSFAAPPRSINGVDLTGEQYSDLCFIMGTLKANGNKTLKETLIETINSPEYKRLSKEVEDKIIKLDDKEQLDEYGNYDPRVRHINKIIRKYKEIATKQLLKIYPDLLNNVNTQRRNKKLAIGGHFEALEQLSK